MRSTRVSNESLLDEQRLSTALHVPRSWVRARVADVQRKMLYLAKLPQAVPPGWVLVHNCVYPTRHIGSRGFRIWLSAPDPTRLTTCGCGWAPELGEHFRLQRDPEHREWVARLDLKRKKRSVR